MDRKAIEKRWKISGSHCTETSKQHDRLHYEGTYFLNGVAFPFSCNEQTSGPRLLRGQVNIFSQSRGQLMRVREKGDNEKPVMLNRSIYPNVLDRDGKPLPKELWRLSVMERVERAAQSLLDENHSKIKRDSELAAAPDTVTPQLALTLYCDAFMRVKHANA